jgi:hypothetical protein
MFITLWMPLEWWRQIVLYIHKPFHRTDTAVYLIKTRNSINMGGYNFRLLKVDPQSQRGEVIKQNEYKLEIIII